MSANNASTEPTEWAARLVSSRSRYVLLVVSTVLMGVGIILMIASLSIPNGPEAWFCFIAQSMFVFGATILFPLTYEAAQ